MTNNTLS